MIEFAVVAPMLLALVFGIFDFGRAMSANVTVTNSAREAARSASTHAVDWPTPTTAGWPLAYQGRFGFDCPTGTPLTVPDAGPTQAAWIQAQAANLDLSQLSITVSYFDPDNDPALDRPANDVQSCSSGRATESNPGYTPASGGWVRVEVSYRYAPVTPVISSMFSHVTVDQTATMVLE